MKILCTAAVFFSLGWHGLNAQQNLSTMRVQFETEKTSVSQAIEKFVSQNKIQQFAYSTTSLSGYSVKPTKCANEPIIACLDQLFKGLPIEALINKNMLIVRKKKNVSLSDLTEEVMPSLAMTDTLRPASSVNKIDEIVVNAGYYNVKEKERTGSITQIRSQNIENQPVNNALGAIQGRAAGVSITQNSGVAGGSFDVQIRGRNSLRTVENSEIDGNQPLYLVDGIPIVGINARTASSVLTYGNINPLNNINPNDIESIEILKDADATAIYGSRGANGVILITTKKGKSGKLSFTFNTQYGISNVQSKLRMMNTEQYLGMRKQAYANDGLSVYPANAYDINGVWNAERYTNWRKVLIGNESTSSNTQLTLTGGNANTTFLVSLSHNEQSTVFGEDFKYSGNNLSSSISHQSTDKRFQITVYNMLANRKNNVVRSDATQRAYFLSPNAPALYLPDGGINWENNTFNNPVAAFNSKYSNSNIQLLSNLNASYRLAKNLNLRLNGGVNYQTFDDISLEPNTMYNPSTVQGQSSATSSATNGSQDRFSLIIEPQISWLKKWNSHTIDLLIGGTFQRDTNNQIQMQGIGFESNALIENIGAAKTKIISDQIRSEYRYMAVYGRLNYQYKNRYILNITGRRDGSSRFGPNNKFANFGAIGAAWIFTNENFLKGSKWLSSGKLRASYGTAGSDNIGDYGYLDTYTVSSLSYDGTAGMLPSRLFNPDYSWEKTTKMEMGLELGFLQNRINFNAAWYRNRSSNQLLGYQLPDITGFPTVIANLQATVENSGVELELNAQPISGDNFKWETSLNVSIPKNRLISFPGLDGSPYARQFVIGQPTSIIKVYEYKGIDPQTGMYKFTDFNGDGRITSPDDDMKIEKLDTKYFGGWNNSFTYKNWDLSFLFQFVKRKSRNYNYVMPIPGSMNNQPIEVLDVWSVQNPNGTYMPYTSKSSAAHTLYRKSDAAISDASFIRLKNIQLSYNIPLRDNIFRSVKIYFQGQNLYTWTKFFGIDPETPGITTLPPLTTYSLGLQFNL
ncbi:SusC/RagA family TonB-linked outer membrane protein [Chryseobacterium sp. G0240]|uniref:SusC/RagA family TonB-linked outer membrane protein n=1 Tax=Chryseobacterium sp. G0240 TaxID=2487066 RepID=UPI000F44CA05|nr:SusC/RagA family TonB-linked outer membrane protein [Chryseobacterium sp. G0240]ROI02524.1 SusC/RagA family TonB-linked outer membrane protein [Chryseobacterium sp. G0240]